MLGTHLEGEKIYNAALLSECKLMSIGGHVATNRDRPVDSRSAVCGKMPDGKRALRFPVTCNVIATSFGCSHTIPRERN